MDVFFEFVEPNSMPALEAELLVHHVHTLAANFVRQPKSCQVTPEHVANFFYRDIDALRHQITLMPFACSSFTAFKTV
ncbi:hypothetical protein NKH49_26915 [Mesorhizobium sp. M1088]|uniref:hypothetical protein n=1 Tax=Mesorhizobium sp. M1088 TaxID=2957056 RepID=UPI00333B4FD4